MAGGGFDEFTDETTSTLNGLDFRTAAPDSVHFNKYLSLEDILNYLITESDTPAPVNCPISLSQTGTTAWQHQRLTKLPDLAKL